MDQFPQAVYILNLFPNTYKQFQPVDIEAFNVIDSSHFTLQVFVIGFLELIPFFAYSFRLSERDLGQSFDRF